MILPEFNKCFRCIPYFTRFYIVIPFLQLRMYFIGAHQVGVHSHRCLW